MEVVELLDDDEDELPGPSFAALESRLSPPFVGRATGSAQLETVDLHDDDDKVETNIKLNQQHQQAPAGCSLSAFLRCGPQN